MTAALVGGGKLTKPIAVKPVEIDTALYVCTTLSAGLSGSKNWTLRPLYEKAEFVEIFPGCELRLTPDAGADGDGYFGVRLKCGRRECVMAPQAEELVVREEGAGS